ncbi:hypothetical protein G7B40_034185 [Aetokthonos hydrillicola Thurmond2011]|uniref:Uncharacterized protein n=1 Tax=Aetokthonos hydrillicola Thurmond2011 TaxID=2712845 RepID=A0AAP5MBS8_9CYAN|nr:hypothetical protein [Aetokthonos hydrillicola CCALA 1050]MDR9899570.1 hypothetical protein [Aetokthonos hydrillicola Thurmond2011]
MLRYKNPPYGRQTLRLTVIRRLQSAPMGASRLKWENPFTAMSFELVQHDVNKATL